MLNLMLKMVQERGWFFFFFSYEGMEISISSALEWQEPLKILCLFFFQQLSQQHRRNGHSPETVLISLIRLTFKLDWQTVQVGGNRKRIRPLPLNKLTRTVVLIPVCTLASPGESSDILMPSSNPRPLTSESLEVAPRHQSFAKLPKSPQCEAKIKKHNLEAQTFLCVRTISVMGF